MDNSPVTKLTIFIENKCQRKTIIFEEKIYLGKRLGRFKSKIVVSGKATYCYKPSGKTANIDVILTHRVAQGEIHISFSTTFSEGLNGVEIITVGEYSLHTELKGNHSLFLHVIVTDD